MKIVYRKNMDELSIDPVQARMALEEMGLLSDVEALVAHPETPAAIRHAWEFTLKFTRRSPSILAAAQLLGWSEEQLDLIFVLGSQKTY
jgi:hypothetical protein